MNRERLEATLNRDENCNLKRHKVDGKDHIGWGINLEEILPDELLEYLGVEDEDDIQEITQEQADYLRDYYINIAEKDAISVFEDELWESLTDLRREVLTNLSYNLGINRFKKFRKMIKAVKDGDWTEAAAQMLDSEAARSQTGERYHRLAPAFEHNDESYLQLPKKFDSVAESDSPTDVPEVSVFDATDLSTLSDAELMSVQNKIHAEITKRLGVSYR